MKPKLDDDAKGSKIQADLAHLKTLHHMPDNDNLQTYKLHALADYPSQIRMYGTTDSYSTQAVHPAFPYAYHVVQHSFFYYTGNLSTVKVKSGLPELITRHTHRS